VRIRVLAVGRLKAGPERELVTRYLDRARAAGGTVGVSGFEVEEVAESRRTATAERQAEEAVALLSRTGSARRVVLDQAGGQATSKGLAETLCRWRDDGVADVAFLIGGPDGHGESVRSSADLVLGFGAMTWPHQLFRAMLAEQLYRAVTILCGHPYHRA
jgi:23S rRNA (pseudouridine1915-N3)-methyltransferase